ncbi:rho guanine nucleotide exchange factor 12-like isoform X2 [Pomacea canaliculata]|uniref:rho guanine nucleotide exchange factor 12-like isoform X2 n=1 Tax=Pomacea canaliculata TaxID=400727 RepID=UPI000D72857B|nr:rho guanine nucleotide exchange factor 12-like isoform X2 [Pomacea canaliculata]
MHIFILLILFSAEHWVYFCLSVSVTVMPLSRKWRSLDFFGSLENLHLPYHPHKHGHKTEHKQEGRQDKHSDGHQKSSFRARLSSLSDKNELKRDDWDGSGVGLVQRCVIIQKDEKGYGLTVSGDNPVYVASVKPEGAAAKAGVQKDDRIVKVNGTLVTKCNHIDVVKLIKSGSYVALTLMGRPNPSSPNAASSANSAFLSSANTLSTPATISNRSSVITAPQPVDPDKDRELWVQKLHMTQAMHDQAKEDFEKLQRQYVRTPTERLHTNLLEKERTVKTLEKQLQQLKVFEEDFAGSSFGQGVPHYQDSSITSAGSISSISSWYPRILLRGDSKHVKQASVPVSLYKSSGEGAGLGPDARAATHVMRSKSDVASRRNRAGLTQSTFYVSISQAAGTGCEGGKGIRRKLKRWKSYSSSLYQRPSESSLGLEQPPCQQPPQVTSGYIDSHNFQNI